MADPRPADRAAALTRAHPREPAVTGSTPPAPVHPPAGAGTSSSRRGRVQRGAAAGMTPGRRSLPAEDPGEPEPGRGDDTGPRPGQGITALAAAMSEAQLEEHIRSLCNDLGLLRFHVRDSRGMNRGLPDDILIGPRGILWRECKTEKGRLTPEQKQTGAALTGLGYDFGVWRPRDLLAGTIARELAAISGIRGAA